MSLPRVRFTVGRMITAVAALAVFLPLERFLFDVAFRAIPSPYHPTGHDVTAETYFLWMALNAAAAAALGPIVYAANVTGCCTLTSRGWPSRLRRLATALVSGFVGAMAGVVVGTVVGPVIGYALDPSAPNPHNLGGLGRGLVTGAVTVMAAYIGFAVGVVWYSRRARSKAGDTARNDLASPL